MLPLMTGWTSRVELLCLCLTGLLGAGCTSEPAKASGGGATLVYPSAKPLGPGEVRAAGPERAPSEPGQQVVLLHCGVQNVMYDDVQWEVENPPIDAGSVPDPTFSGFGSWYRDSDVLTFTDDQGAVLRFTRWDGTPDPEVCA